MRREHRVVVLPEWQGLGIGPRLSDLSAQLWTATPHGAAGNNWLYSCRTAHPRFGACAPHAYGLEPPESIAEARLLL